MKRVVQFDMDGVLADFDLGYREIYNELYGVMKQRPTRWNESNDYGVWEEIKKSTGFWATLDLLCTEDEIKRVAALSSRVDVYFVTNRVGIDPKVQSEVWLRTHKIYNPTVIVSGQKAEMARAIGATHAIDDKFGNAYMVSCYSRGTKTFLLDAPYNQVDHGIVGGSVTRIKTLSEFLDEVER